MRLIDLSFTIEEGMPVYPGDMPTSIKRLDEPKIVEAGWFGGPLAPHVTARLGDVALVAREPVAFLDPADTGETRLAARHGSLTAAEMYVPLIAWAAD